MSDGESSPESQGSAVSEIGRRALLHLLRASDASTRSASRRPPFSRTQSPCGPADSLPLHRAVLDAVVAHDPVRAEKATRALIDSAANDIEQVLAGRKRLPRVDTPAALLIAS